MTRHLFTIGHSNHTAEHFLALLAEHQVTAVADVRSAPYSRFASQFNKEALRQVLTGADIKYAFLGRELGARPTDPTCYDGGRVQYDRLAQTDLFHTGLDRLVIGSEQGRVAIMCTEKDPLDCHRTILIARALVEKGHAVDHILADGSLETFDDSMLRLLDKTRQPPPDFFTSLDERIEKALKDQEQRIAHVDERSASTGEETPS